MVVVAVALVLVSGGSDADPRTPPALPGMPPPFLGTAVAGGGGVTAAIDAYGDVVDLRAPGPAGPGPDRQPGGSAGGGNRPVRHRDRAAGQRRPRAAAAASGAPTRSRSATCRGRTWCGRWPGSDEVKAVVSAAPPAGPLAETLEVQAPAGESAVPTLSANLIGGSGARCRQSRRPGEAAIVCSTGASALDEGSSSAAERRGPDHPRQRRRRSLLDRSGAAAGDRRTGLGEADVRALAADPAGADRPAQRRRRRRRSRRLGLRLAARRRHRRPRLRRLRIPIRGAPGRAVPARPDLGAAARFEGDGAPVPGRGAQGDAAGWVAVAARAAGLPAPTRATAKAESAWRDRADYQEGAPGDYLANAIASMPARRRSISSRPFGSPQGLVRRAGDPGSGLDSAAAWAVRPFPQPALFPAVRRTLLTLSARSDPLRDHAGRRLDRGRRSLVGADRLDRLEPRRARRQRTPLRRPRVPTAARRCACSATCAAPPPPAGALPERVDATTGVPRSTTPLAWSHAFAILALRQLWPGT